MTDIRPANCRNRLQDEGKAHPRSGCNHSGCGGILGGGCPFEKTPEELKEQNERRSHIPILRAEELGKKYGYDQVIIFARRIGENSLEWITTWGKNKTHCDAAARIGDALRLEVTPALQAKDDKIAELQGKLDKINECFQIDSMYQFSSEDDIKFIEQMFANEPPDWAKDSFNFDSVAKCYHCGAWESMVRPGQTQCENCGNGRDKQIIIQSILLGRV